MTTRPGNYLTTDSAMFVVATAGREAVVELAEEAVVEVAQGGGVPFAAGPSAVVVLSCSLGMGYGCEGPVVAGRGEPVVLHPPVQDQTGLGQRRESRAPPRRRP